MKLPPIFALASPILMFAACSPDNETSEQVAPQAKHIDSEITIESIERVTAKATVRQLLTSLGLCSETDLGEDVLSLIDFHDRESSVNFYTLVGGGGLGFTTRYQVENGEDVYSLQVLDYTVTSFEYSIDGTSYFASLNGENYVVRAR
jgi:hypothetical protein